MIMLFVNIEKSLYLQRDLNPCRRRERAMSWPLDDEGFFY